MYEQTQDPISRALTMPSGMRFYRCALQVNPYPYLIKYNKPTSFADEKSYNAAMIQACKDNGIEVIAVTDHYNIQNSKGLCQDAKDAGLYVFPGFEAVAKDGVHILCLFDLGTTPEKLERLLGDCGIHDDRQNSPVGKYDTIELLEQARNSLGAICIAAHVASNGGLLRHLKNTPRINAWRSQNLLACSLPGSIADAPDDIRPILENKNPDYRREQPVAIVNAQDVNSPEDLGKSGTTCWIKMSSISPEGLRLAFLDPESRIRLATDPTPTAHTEIAAITWQGGFLDGQSIHLNENLNVLIGGRGTGKSTIVESLRYALGNDPLGEETRQTHEGILKHVLRGGTVVSLLVRSYHPSKREYRIERTIPNPPVVRDEQGQILNLTPQDVIRAEVYGQHEIAELARRPEKLTRLLERFIERDPNLSLRKTDLARELERSRLRLVDIQKEIAKVEEQLATLPGLEETLRRFQEAGLEERLREQSLLVREERVLKTARERLIPYRELLDALRRELPVDRAFLSPKSLEDLPGKGILIQTDEALGRLDNILQSVVSQVADALEKAEKEVATVQTKWEERKSVVQAAYEKILRDLQKSSVDGAEFIRLRQHIEELRPLNERHALLQRDATDLEQRRRGLLVDWEDVKSAEFRQFETAAKKVSRALANRVRVQVNFAGDREPLLKFLRDEVGGRLSEALDALCAKDAISLVEFTEALRAGKENVRDKFNIPLAQAERLVQMPTEAIMRIEELDLKPTTRVELNVASSAHSPVWQALGDLSTGQKATAVLLLLLLESDSPLIIDQPEDDLDNRFITEGIVPQMREEKHRRQFIFTTHNANIPVLGDAELIVGLRAMGEADQGRAEMPIEHMGSIDSVPVRELVENLLEGGKAAFELRRLKYGF